MLPAPTLPSRSIVRPARVLSCATRGRGTIGDGRAQYRLRRRWLCRLCRSWRMCARRDSAWGESTTLWELGLLSPLMAMTHHFVLDCRRRRRLWAARTPRILTANVRSMSARLRRRRQTCLDLLPPALPLLRRRAGRTTSASAMWIMWHPFAPFLIGCMRLQGRLVPARVRMRRWRVSRGISAVAGLCTLTSCIPSFVPLPGPFAVALPVTWSGSTSGPATLSSGR